MGVMRAICFGMLLAFSAADASLPVRWRTMTSSKPGFYKASVQIPQFGTNDPVARFANDELRKKARTLLNSFVSSAYDPKFKPSLPYEYQLRAVVGVAEPGLISYYLTEYSFTGGAHGNTALTGWSYGMVGNRPGPLKFANLQRNRMESRAAATQIVLPALNDAKRIRGGDPVTELPPTTTDNFVITRAGMTWLFSPYDVGPYAEGAYFVKVPWTDMQGTVRKPAALGPEETEMIDRGFVNLAGKAAYRERILMPEASRASFRLIAGSVTVDEAETSVRQAMAGFQVRLNTKSWPAGVPGQIQIRFLEPGGKVRFVNQKAIPIERWGTESPLDVLMVAPPSVGLEGPRWLLSEMDGAGLPGGRTRRPYLEFDPKTGRFGSMSGINQLSGTYTVSGTTLAMKPGPSTLMAGPQEDMDRERRFVQTLARVNRFEVKGNVLHLYAGSTLVMKFERA